MGNGSSIRIWHDQQLDRPHLFRHLMHSFSVVGVEYVADLIVVEMTSWNIILVTDLFLLDEAAMILATSLSCRLPSDKLIWHYDAKGFFSVRSAYKVTLRLHLRSRVRGALRCGKLYGGRLYRVKQRCVVGRLAEIFCLLVRE